MARIPTAALAVTLACALAGCSSSATTSDPSTSPTTTVAAPAPAPGSGSFECGALDGSAGATFSLGIQFLAQLRNQDTVDLVKDGTANYDPDALAAVLDSLDGLPKGPLGDPAADLDFYRQANDKAKEILAVDGPVPASMFDDLVALEGDIGSFIGRQASITASYSEECG
jgi:hypothetical protein